MITEPGVYQMDADAYHRDPALSSSGARKLLAPSCPALFRWWRDHEQAPSRVFDFGHAAHKMVLGEGPELVVVDAADWRTKAAKEARDDAYAAGMVPLLSAEYQQVRDMACELRAHPIAGRALQQPGRPEQSLFSIDEATGVMLRARVDWLPDAVDGRITVVDYKTAASVEPAGFARSMARWGYHIQDPFYRDIILALDLAEEVEFIFLAQSKEPPYLVQPFKLSEYSLEVGRKKARKAIDLFARCVRHDEWPAFSEGVTEIDVPVWADDDEIVIS